MGGRAGPITYISVFATETSVTGVFPYEHSSPLTGTKLVCISTLGVCELALFVYGVRKVTRVYKALTVAKYTSSCSTILVVFLEFIPVDQAEISHMNTPQNSSR